MYHKIHPIKYNFVGFSVLTKFTTIKLPTNIFIISEGNPIMISVHSSPSPWQPLVCFLPIAVCLF